MYKPTLNKDDLLTYYKQNVFRKRADSCWCSGFNLNDFKTWATVNLKAFLHLRGKISEGDQESLAAKALSAWYDKVPVKPKLEHNERCIRAEYKAKLVINKDIVIPDPLTLKSGWIG